VLIAQVINGDFEKSKSMAAAIEISPSLGTSVAPSINEDGSQPFDGYSIFEDDHDDHSRADTLESTGLHDLPVKARDGAVIPTRRRLRHPSDHQHWNGSPASRPASFRSVSGSVASTSRHSTVENGSNAGALVLYTTTYLTVQESVSRALEKLAQLLGRRKTEILTVKTRAEFASSLSRRRIKHMPHRGSVLDRILKRAELFSSAVDQYAIGLETEQNPVLGGSRLIMSCLQLILQASSNKAALCTG
jgi:hypothetical protein